MRARWAARGFAAVLCACGDQRPAPVGDWTDLVFVTTLPGDDPTLTADLLELYFDHTDDDIYMMTRSSLEAAWSEPARVAELSSATSESTPEISPDGLTMLFASDRPGGAGGLDIWMSTRASRAEPWSPPIPVIEVNTADDEFSPAMSPDRRTLALARTVADPDLYLAERDSGAGAWPAPVRLVELATTGIDSEPHLPSSDVLYFSSSRSGGIDLFEARREAGAFIATPLSINTAAIEADPWVAPDQRTLFFMREPGELWMATR